MTNPAPDRSVFRDRQRAESFGTSAEVYDALRPSYPAELITWLGESGRGSAADVGCGTGQVARLLVAAGWQVTGVEIDDRMAAVARSHGVEVDVSSFEQWRPPLPFDLIASGQAWHWIDPDHGYQRAAELLRPGGLLALFWNSYGYDQEMRALIQQVVPRHAPRLMLDSVPFGTTSPDHVALDAEMVRRSAEWFGEPELRTFAHRRRLSVEDWLAELQTHSPLAMLDDPVRAGFLADFRSSLASAEVEGVEVLHETRATVVSRR